MNVLMGLVMGCLTAMRLRLSYCSGCVSLLPCSFVCVGCVCLVSKATQMQMLLTYAYSSYPRSTPAAPSCLWIDVIDSLILARGIGLVAVCSCGYVLLAMRAERMHFNQTLAAESSGPARGTRCWNQWRRHYNLTLQRARAARRSAALFAMYSAACFMRKSNRTSSFSFSLDLRLR